jgi:hypothetical protein
MKKAFLIIVGVLANSLAHAEVPSLLNIVPVELGSAMTPKANSEIHALRLKERNNKERLPLQLRMAVKKASSSKYRGISSRH